MTDISIDTFKAALIGGGSRPNLFRVMLAVPPIGLAANTGGVPTTSGLGVDLVTKGSFLIKSASLPSVKVEPIEVKYQGRKLKIPGDKSFDEWKIKVINDADNSVRDFFEKWSNAINSHVGNVALSLTPSAFMADWSVEQLSKTGDLISAYYIVGCWPSEIGEIELSWDNENEIEEFEVTLPYQYWIRPIAGGTGGTTT